MKYKWLPILLLTVILVGSCTTQSAEQPQSTAVPLPSATPIVVSNITENAEQIWSESTYLATLKFKRHDAFDPFKNAWENELKATRQTLIVGEKTYEEWQVGQEISNEFDTAGLIFNGDLASYVVSVEDKQELRNYFWKDRTENVVEITEEEYNLALRQLEESGTVITIPFSGINMTYILEKTIEEYNIQSTTPLNRYYVQLLIKNESITLDFTKMIRNATNEHHIVLEVSEQAYEQSYSGEAWNPDWNVGSLIFSGRLSRLHGYIEDKWTEVDPKYVIAVLDTGKEIILPVEILPQ